MLNTEIEELKKRLNKLEAEFYAHNHNDIVPRVKGDRSNILDVRLLKVGRSSTTNPAIQFASISSDPNNPTNGDMWFNGEFLKIRISGTSYLLTGITTSSSTTTTSSSTTTTSTSIT